MAGVTLIELMVAVAIVGILAAFAYPSYTRYVVRANRAVAKGLLLQVADRQEQYFADHKAYAANLSLLGYPANTIMVDNQGARVADASTSRIYRISLTNTAATTFTANATPQLSQSTRDSGCATMTLTHRGLKGQSGTATNCW
jgi:type IV pilus assembly protein PilE